MQYYVQLYIKLHAHNYLFPLVLCHLELALGEMSRIYQGQVDPPGSGDFPHHVTLAFYDPTCAILTIVPFCGGSLITLTQVHYVFLCVIIPN